MLLVPLLEAREQLEHDLPGGGFDLERVEREYLVVLRVQRDQFVEVLVQFVAQSSQLVAVFVVFLVETGAWQSALIK